MEKRVCGCGLRPKSKEERNLELRRDAARIVAGVENYSDTDRARRGADIAAAFPPAKPAVAKAVPKKKAAAKPAVKKKPAAKTAAKGPTPAGMSVGPHDGDLC